MEATRKIAAGVASLLDIPVQQAEKPEEGLFARGD